MLIDNIFVKCVWWIFQQTVVIAKGNNLYNYLHILIFCTTGKMILATL